MAYREVQATDTRKFLKIRDVFPEVGSVFKGIYVSDAPNETLENSPRDYVFKIKSGEEIVLTAASHLKGQLKHAELQPGELVTITFEREKDIGKASPMRMFKIGVEDGKATTKPAAKTGFSDF